MQIPNAFWARLLTFGLVLLLASTTVLMINMNPLEIGLFHLALLGGVIIVGLMTNTRIGLVGAVVSIFIITLVNRYNGLDVPEPTSLHTAAELMTFFVVGPMAGRLGTMIGQIQHQATHWQAQAEAQTVHDKTFGTLKPAWAEVRLQEEMLRAKQFGRPLSVMLLQVNPESDVAVKIPHNYTAVLQAIIRLSKSFTQPPAVVTCLAENQVLLILPEYTGEQADDLGHKLLNQSANVLYFPDKEAKSLGIPVSQWGQVQIGVASLNGHDINTEMFLTQARHQLTEKSMKHGANGTNGHSLEEPVFIKLASG